MKKVFAFFLSLFLLFTLSISAFAADVEPQPVHAEYWFYDDFNMDSANLVYKKDLGTQYVMPGDEVYVAGASTKNFYFFATVTGFEKFAWQGGLYMVTGGGNPDPFEYEGYLDVRGTMINEPIDIIFTYSPYADYYYVEHYCGNQLVETEKILGIIGQSYTGVYKAYEGFEPVSATSGSVPLRYVGVNPLTLVCTYQAIEPEITPTPTPEITPTPTPEATSTPKPAGPTVTSKPANTPKPTKAPTPTPKVVRTSAPQIIYQQVTTPPTPEPRIIYFMSEPDPTPQMVYVMVTPEPTENIPDDDVPLAQFNEPEEITDGGHWALLNLVLMLCSALGMIKFEEKKKYNVFNVMFAVASIIVFVFTENTFLPMVFVDKYTLFMLFLFICEGLSHFFMKNKEESNLEKSENL